MWASNRTGAYSVWRKRADQSREEEQLLQTAREQVPAECVDGRAWTDLVATERRRQLRHLGRPTEREHRVIPVLNSAFEERGGPFAPDGQWFAYSRTRPAARSTSSWHGCRRRMRESGCRREVAPPLGTPTGKELLLHRSSRPDDERPDPDVRRPARDWRRQRRCSQTIGSRSGDLPSSAATVLHRTVSGSHADTDGQSRLQRGDGHAQLAGNQVVAIFLGILGAGRIDPGPRPSTHDDSTTLTHGTATS